MTSEGGRTQPVKVKHPNSQVKRNLHAGESVKHRHGHNKQKLKSTVTKDTCKKAETDALCHREDHQRYLAYYQRS